MTNKEAISVLESISAKTDYFLINDDARAEAIDMAISALQAQDAPDINIGDTISRQAEIDSVQKYKYEHGYDYADCVFNIEKDLKALPPAQPENICCKDCKNSEHWYRDKRRCFLWDESGIDVFEDGYCNYAERREEGGE